MIPPEKSSVKSLPYRRLRALGIAGSGPATPAQVVSHLGAMQAQDYPGVLWSIALRTPDATKEDVEQAISDRTIVRTWPMRGTLHMLAAEDIRWMTRLLTPRVIRGAAGRWRQLGLDDEAFDRARTIFGRALSGGKQLTRAAMYAAMAQGGVSPDGQRGIHILGRLSQEGLLCFAAHSGKEATFALLEEWVAPAPEKTREEALGELARRYFTGHGPATLRDFIWWTGLTVVDAKEALSLAKAYLACETIDGTEYWSGPDKKVNTHMPSLYLLPGFDEYLLGYTDRTAVLHPSQSQRIVPGNNGMFLPTIVADGSVVGTWKKTLTKTARITPTLFEDTELDPNLLATQAQRYGAFLGLDCRIG